MVEVVVGVVLMGTGVVVVVNRDCGSVTVPAGA